MEQIKDTLFIIPARGGSKGLPGKNIKQLKGKPLICYAIDAARGVTSDENICVSTDDTEIIKVVESCGLKVPFIRPEIFPNQLLPLLAKHFRNPKASSDTDAKLAIALKQFDQKETDKNYIFEIPMGSHFRIHNGKIFKKIALRVKRYECMEISSGRMYLFQPNAEVELLPN